MDLPVNGKVNYTVALCAGILVTGAQPGVGLPGRGTGVNQTFQATVSGTGAVTATVQVEVSNDGVGWLVDSTATLSLTGTTTASAGFTSNAPWKFARANITAISGTGAAVTVTAGG